MSDDVEGWHESLIARGVEFVKPHGHSDWFQVFSSLVIPPRLPHRATAISTGERYERIPIDPESWIERACELAGGTLNADEWRQFVSPTRPYDPAC